MPGPPCLVDTNTFVVIRSLVRADPSLDPLKVIGSDVVVISQTVYDELMFGLPPTDHKVGLNDRLVDWMGGRVVRVTETDGDQADLISRLYARHDPAPDDVDDALIAATSIRPGRVLLTRNQKHFHYILGLRYVNVTPWPMPLPILTTRPIEAGNHTRPCCQRLKSAKK